MEVHAQLLAMGTLILAPVILDLRVQIAKYVRYFKKTFLTAHKIVND